MVTISVHALSVPPPPQCESLWTAFPPPVVCMPETVLSATVLFSTPSVSAPVLTVCVHDQVHFMACIFFSFCLFKWGWGSVGHFFDTER